MGNSDLNALVRDVIDQITKLPPEQRPGAVSQIKDGVITATKIELKRAQDVFENISKSLHHLEYDTTTESVCQDQEATIEYREGRN